MTPNLLQGQGFVDPAGALDLRTMAEPVSGRAQRWGTRPQPPASPGAGRRVATVTLVCFQVAGTAYCMSVEHTRSVRLAEGLVPLPMPGRDIVGVVPGNPPLTVIAPLGPSGGHVLVVAAGGKTFGLLVGEVTRLLTVPTGDLGAAPTGQHLALISGTVDVGGQLLMIIDPMTMVDSL